MTTKKTKIFKKIIFCCFSLCIFVQSSPTIVGYSSNQADIEYYFTWMQEDGSWHEWIPCTKDTVTERFTVSVRVGQPLQCKVEVTTHIKSTISIELYEPGVTKAYDVLEGNPHEKPIQYGIFPTGEIFWLEPETSISYTWVVQPNWNWTEGHAPLNGFCEVSDTSTLTEPLIVEVTFANPYICAEQWTGPRYTSKNSHPTDDMNTKGTPGFDLFIILIALSIIVLCTELIIRQMKKN